MCSVVYGGDCVGMWEMCECLCVCVCMWSVCMWESVCVRVCDCVCLWSVYM